MKYNDLTLGQIEAMVNKLGGMEGVNALLADGLKIEKISFIKAKFSLSVNYDLTLEEMISAGNYNMTDPNITQEHFPVSGQDVVEKEIFLFHFNKPITSEEVIKEMDKNNLKPANIEDLLYLGAKQPDLQREFPLIALGSVWQDPDDDRYVPYLCCDDSRRKLDLSWFDYSWNSRYRFVAVRK